MTEETVSYGVNDLKIAVRNATNSYGTLLDVWGVSSFEVTVENKGSRLEGDDVVLRAHSRIIAAQIKCKFAFKDLAVYGALTGKTVFSGTSLDYIEYSNDSMPYIGICAQVLSDDENGDTHLFAPMGKLMSGFSLRAEYGQFITPEMTIDCVKDDTYGIFRKILHANTTPITIPPSFS